jgi:hypothetical protein
MKRDARQDRNHNEVKDYFEDYGCSVLNIFQLKNCADIIVAKNNITCIVEIKDGLKCPSQRKLSDGEIKFRDSWLGEWRLVETLEDAAAIVLEFEW